MSASPTTGFTPVQSIRAFLTAACGMVLAVPKLGTRLAAEGELADLHYRHRIILSRRPHRPLHRPPRRRLPSAAAHDGMLTGNKFARQSRIIVIDVPVKAVLLGATISSSALRKLVQSSPGIVIDASLHFFDSIFELACCHHGLCERRKARGVGPRCLVPEARPDDALSAMEERLFDADNHHEVRTLSANCHLVAQPTITHNQSLPAYT